MVDEYYIADKSSESRLSYERRKAGLSPMGVIVISLPTQQNSTPGGTILDVDASVMNYFDYLKRSDLIGKPIEILLPADLHSVHEQHRVDWTKYPKDIAMGNRGKGAGEVRGKTSKGAIVYPLLAIRYLEFTTETAVFFDDKGQPILEVGVGYLIDPSHFAAKSKQG